MSGSVGSDGVVREGEGQHMASSPQPHRRRDDSHDVQPEFTAIQRIPLQTWAMIVALIVAIATMGFQINGTQRELEKKADSAVVREQVKRLEEKLDWVIRLLEQQQQMQRQALPQSQPQPQQLPQPLPPR